MYFPKMFLCLFVPTSLSVHFISFQMTYSNLKVHYVNNFYVADFSFKFKDFLSSGNGLSKIYLSKIISLLMI